MTSLRSIIALSVNVLGFCILMRTSGIEACAGP
jgi:hypothetical protein